VVLEGDWSILYEDVDVPTSMVYVMLGQAKTLLKNAYYGFPQNQMTNDQKYRSGKTRFSFNITDAPK